MPKDFIPNTGPRDQQNKCNRVMNVPCAFGMLNRIAVYMTGSTADVIARYRIFEPQLLLSQKPFTKRSVAEKDSPGSGHWPSSSRCCGAVTLNSRNKHQTWNCIRQ
jgi:hypothetical protein